MVPGKYPGKNHSLNHPDLSICEFNKKRTDPRNTPSSFEVRSQYYVIFKGAGLGRGNALAVPGDSRLRGFWAEPKWSTYVPFPSSQDPLFLCA